MKATIDNLHGERERISLGTPLLDCAATGPQDETGIWHTGLWRGPRTGRMVLRTYSIWDDGRGCCRGEAYTEIDLSDFLAICRRHGIEVPGQIAAVEL